MRKICTKCKESKELTEFFKQKSAKDGVQHYCKICDRANNRDWIKDNPKRKKEANDKWRKTNPEKMKELVAKWVKNNPERVKENVAKWAKNNPESRKRTTATRQDRIKQATPPWLSAAHHDAIKSLKQLCKNENLKIKEPKKKLSVNHLIPIYMTDTGTTVGKHIASGLHVPWNMKLVSVSENSKIACSMDPTLYKVL